MQANFHDVVEAHGWLRSWSQLERITALVSLEGPFWASRGWPGVHQFQKVTLDPKSRRIAFVPFTGPDKTCVFDARQEMISIFADSDDAGPRRIDIREPPPLLFEDEAGVWDTVQLAHFTSTLLWNHFLMPCALGWDDANIEEIAPWIDGDQIWRRLAIDHHSVRGSGRRPILSFDEQLALRRLDYDADASAGIAVAHHFIEHNTFGGHLLPKRSRIHLGRDHQIGLNETAPITFDLMFANVE